MSLAEVEVDPLVQLASVLSPRPSELVAAVRSAAGTALPDILDSPERLRLLAVSTLLADRGPVAPAEPLDGLPGSLVELVERVNALPRFDRAVLVLVDVEHLTRAETAGLLDRPVATVNHALDRALAALDADPYALAAVWLTVAWRTLDPAEISRAEVRLAGRRRTRSRRRGLIVTGIALLVAAAILPGAIHTLTPDDVWLRGHREWVLSYRLTAPDGWKIDSRTVAADVETAELTPTGTGPGHCQIVVGQPVADDPTREPARTARVNGRAARLTTAFDHAVLTWVLGADASATVSCTRVADAADFVTTLGRRIVFAPEPILLPYRLGVIPSHFHVAQVTVWPQTGESTADLWPDEVLSSGVPIAIDQAAVSPDGLQMWSMPAGDPQMYTSCRLVEPTSVCAGVARPGAVDSTLEQTRTSRRLRMIMEGLTAASSGTDRSTWFDARSALPVE